MGRGTRVPAEAEPSHGQGGRCLLRVRGAGGAAGPACLPWEPHVVVGCLQAWGKKTGLKWGLRGSQSPLACVALLFRRDAIESRQIIPTSPAPCGFWLQGGLASTCTYLLGLWVPLKSPISQECRKANGKRCTPRLGFNNPNGRGLPLPPHTQ